MKVRTELDLENKLVNIIIDVEEKGLRLIMRTNFDDIKRGIEALYNTQKNPLLAPALGIVSKFLGIGFEVKKIEESSNNS